jgi:pyridoxamine 5'-phosphate oxidase
MRKNYTQRTLRRDELDENPFMQFEKWFNEAMDEKLIEPNAFTLATVGLDMKPSQRVVLLKMYDKNGFVFFSNYKSKKGLQIEQNKYVSAHFSWLGLERQVRIEGSIEKISKA